MDNTSTDSGGRASTSLTDETTTRCTADESTFSATAHIDPDSDQVKSLVTATSRTGSSTTGDNVLVVSALCVNVPVVSSRETVIVEDKLAVPRGAVFRYRHDTVTVVSAIVGDRVAERRVAHAVTVSVRDVDSAARDDVAVCDARVGVTTAEADGVGVRAGVRVPSSATVSVTETASVSDGRDRLRVTVGTSVTVSVTVRGNDTLLLVKRSVSVSVPSPVVVAMADTVMLRSIPVDETVVVSLALPDNPFVSDTGVEEPLWEAVDAGVHERDSVPEGFADGDRVGVRRGAGVTVQEALGHCRVIERERDAVDESLAVTVATNERVKLAVPAVGDALSVGKRLVLERKAVTVNFATEADGDPPDEGDPLRVRVRSTVRCERLSVSDTVYCVDRVVVLVICTSVSVPISADALGVDERGV